MLLHYFRFNNKTKIMCFSVFALLSLDFTNIST